MTDLETKLLACEKEPSVELLSYTADEYLSAGDEEIYRALSYMAENRKFPWKTSRGYSWWGEENSVVLCHFDGFSEILSFDVSMNNDLFDLNFSFADAVRWLGKKLNILGIGN